MKIIVYINFILTLLLIGTVAWLIGYQKPKVNDISNNLSPKEDIIQYIDKCGEDCKKQIVEIINSNKNSEVEAKSDENTKTTVTTSVPVVTKTQIAYIPISGTVTTTSSDWYDVPNTDFYLDIEKNYSKNYTANWSASLKVAHSNGTAYARLFDVTHGIAVNGSEVKLSDTSNSTQVFSGNLSFWSGNNLYRVQFKSLNTFEITFGGGQIKIVY